MKVLWILSVSAICICSAFESVMTRRSQRSLIWWADVIVMWIYAICVIAAFWIGGWKSGLLLLGCTLVLKAILDRILSRR